MNEESTLPGLAIPRDTLVEVSSIFTGLQDLPESNLDALPHQIST